MTSGDAKPPIPEGWAGEPLLILFFIPAPEALALPHGMTLRIERDETVEWMKGVPVAPIPGYTWHLNPEGKNMVSVRIWRAPEEVKFDLTPFHRAMQAIQITTGSEITEEAIPSIPIQGPSYATVIEAVTSLIPAFDDHGELDVIGSISEAFDRCIESLSDLYRPYIINFRDINVRIPGRINVFPLIPWTTKDPFSSEVKLGGIEIFFAGPAAGIIPQAVDIADDAQIQRMIHVLQRTKMGDPLTVYSEHSLAAGRSLMIDSDYPAAVVRSHIASEVLMNSILLLMAWERNTSEEEVSRWSRWVLIRKIEECYPKFLSGNWRTEEENTIIGHWMEYVHRVRNRVVHEGYFPTDDEAHHALDVVSALSEHMKNCILTHWSTYPRTALLMIGTEGLQNRGIVSGDIHEFFEREAQNIVSWIGEFGDWAQKFRR